MHTVWRTLLWALAISLLLAAILLWGVFRYGLFLPDGGGRPPAYTIGAWEGKVAVFEGDQPFPRQVFEVYVEALPPEQRRQVQAGVAAENDAQLSVLLEDYTG